MARIFVQDDDGQDYAYEAAGFIAGYTFGSTSGPREVEAIAHGQISLSERLSILNAMLQSLSLEFLLSGYAMDEISKTFHDLIVEVKIQTADQPQLLERIRKQKEGGLS
ncbi:hypothetical protein [Paenibacillus pasadenensis]|nr:hypothetical protein [Paenibacillus pasadenensis]